MARIKRPGRRVTSVWFFITPHQHEAMRRIHQAGSYGLPPEAIMRRTEHTLMEKKGGPLIEARTVKIYGKPQRRLFLTKRGEKARLL